VNKRWVATGVAFSISLAAILFLFCLVESSGPYVSRSAQAAVKDGAPTVSGVDPSSAPNDLDTLIVITGTDFAAVVSGTQVITPPSVYVDGTALDDVQWGSTRTLSATVQWGLDPGVYTVTVVNPDALSGTLTGAFTVTQGIGVWDAGALYGGYIPELLIHPVTPTIVYAVAYDAGVFASYDGGAHWEMILSITGPGVHLALDAQDPDVMYCAAGSSNFYRSMDGGSTWEALTTPLEGPGASNAYFLAAHPVTAGVAYVGAVSYAHNPPPYDQGGIYKSTDYGDTWITRTNGLTDTQITRLAFRPDQPETMLAGTEDGNIFASGDGGDTWRWSIQLSDTVTALYSNPDTPGEAWASAVPAWGSQTRLYRSSDLVTWTSVSVDPGLEHSSDAWVMEFISDTIWIASVGIYTSTDGGTNWDRVTFHKDAVGFDINPQDPNEIYVGSVGAYKSTDGARNWQQINEGLSGLVPQAIAVKPGDPETLYVKVDGLVESNNGGHSWRYLLTEIGGYPSYLLLAVDPISTTRIYFGGLAENGTVPIMQISPDAGNTWQVVTLTVPLTYSGWRGRPEVVHPHPDVPGRVFTGMAFEPWDFHDPVCTPRGGLNVSSDHGESWTYIEPSQPISSVVDIAYDTADPDLIYMGTCGTGLWKSTDGGASWQATSFPQPIVRSIAAHPHISGTVYAYGWKESGEAPFAGLYFSQDAGGTWTFLGEYSSDGLLLFAPTYPATLYTGLMNGLHSSTDGGYNWETVEAVPDGRIQALAWGSDGERVIVYVGTAGGVVSSADQASATSNGFPGRGSVTGGGVYHLTTVLPDHWVYLPLVCRNCLVLTDSVVTGDSLPSKQRSEDYEASCRDRRIH
jgi:photosystem II stability/assembly factor-like uncharacterized protein